MCVNCTIVADIVEACSPGSSRHPQSSRRLWGDLREQMISRVRLELSDFELTDRDCQEIETAWDLILMVRNRCVEGHFSPAGGVHCKRRCHFPEHRHGPPEFVGSRRSSAWVTSRVVARYGRMLATG